MVILSVGKAFVNKMILGNNNMGPIRVNLVQKRYCSTSQKREIFATKLVNNQSTAERILNNKRLDDTLRLPLLKITKETVSKASAQHANVILIGCNIAFIL